MTDNKYFGWTNYATWRINNEIFDGWKTDGQEVCKESVHDVVEGLVEISAPDGLAKDYAMAFIADVNWKEISDHINETNEE
jgi:hypothetical protein